MICNNCDKDLAQCTCPDLEERFKGLQKSKYVRLGIEYQARILAHIEELKKQNEGHNERGTRPGDGTQSFAD